MTIPLFDFAGSHPWVFCWAIWPIALWLITLAWFTAALTEQGLNFILGVGNLVCNTLVLLARGYAPQSVEATKTEVDPNEGARE